MNDKNEEMPTSAVAAIRNGSKIEAIKIVREASGMGLKEAKEAVEAYVDKHPDLKRELDAASAAQGKSFLTALVVLALLGALAYFGLEKFG